MPQPTLAEERELLTELLARKEARKSMAAFSRYIAPHQQPALHHLLLCDQLDNVIEGRCKRLMVMMPPGSAKSTFATVRFPAYFLGRMGARGIVSASYDDDLANNFGRHVRNLVRSPEYQRVFPHVQLAADSKAKGEWATAEGGFYFAAGVGSAINGRRGALGVIDDPMKGRKASDSELIRHDTWEWYINDFRSRLWPESPIVLIGTRWHMDDPAGRILPDTWNGESGWVTAKDGENWYVLCIPAEAREGDPLGRKPGEWLWTDWFNEAYWEQTKRTALLNDVRNWNALYQQIPADDAGTFFQREWFANRYVNRPEFLNVYVSGDFAVTEGAGDFTEIAVWGVAPNEDIYCLDWWHGQTTADVWISALVDKAKRWDAHIFVGEMGPIRRAIEPFLEHTLRDLSYSMHLEWMPTANGKDANARTFQALASQRRVHFPDTEWAERVVNQLCKFPAGKHDDCVDACSIFARHIHKTWGAVTPRIVNKELQVSAWNALPKIAEFFKPARKESW